MGLHHRTSMGRQSSTCIINIIHSTRGSNWGEGTRQEGQERPEEEMTLGDVGPEVEEQNSATVTSGGAVVSSSANPS